MPYGPTKSIVANVLICLETVWQSFQVLPHARGPDGLFCGWNTSATFSGHKASLLANFHLISSHISHGRIRIGVHDTSYSIGRAEYHNGGVWPFVLGFYVAAIVAAGFPLLARRKLAALTEFIRNSRNSSLAFGFNEWVRASDGVACGEDWELWSRGYVPLCRSVRGTKAGLAVSARSSGVHEFTSA